jgi:hypothetical protein
MSRVTGTVRRLARNVGCVVMYSQSQGLDGNRCVPGAKPSIRVDNPCVPAASGAASWESVGVPRTASRTAVLGASWPPSTTSAADTARILATLSRMHLMDIWIIYERLALK